MSVIKRFVVSFSVVIASLVGITPSANAAVTGVAPLGSASYNDATTFSISGLPTLAPGSFKIRIILLSNTNIYRIATIKDSDVISGSFSASIDPLLPNSSFLSTNTSATSILSYGLSSGTSVRFPSGMYNVSFEYADAATPSSTLSVTQTNVTFGTTGTLCTAGNYSNTGLAPCTPAAAGNYVSEIGQDGEFQCFFGTYQSATGQSSCILASAGTFVSGSGATFALPCELGKFQPNSGGRTCINAQANHYVHLTGQSSQTACPNGYTSAVASTSSSACIAPVFVSTPAAPVVVSTPAAPVVAALPTCSTKKGKLVKKSCLLKATGLKVPKNSVYSLSVAKASKNICRVSGTSIKGLKVGQCAVSVKIKPKKGRATSETTTIAVLK